MPCRARRPDGEVCPATAIVLREDRIYEARVSWERGGSFEHMLVGTRYLLECPRCGTWERTDAADPS
ncbi:MAG TPA: hypothetical protein VEQ85_01205 [Lacipirellulaceae bacterium]|nr:hypothetical protein [Lacipirellulaceae bacterium]